MWRHVVLMMVGVTIAWANPISRQVGFSDDISVTQRNQTQVCIIDGVEYEDGEFLPTVDPCEECQCRPPGFACTVIGCEYKPGCRAILRDDRCCPDYRCDAVPEVQKEIRTPSTVAEVDPPSEAQERNTELPVVTTEESAELPVVNTEESPELPVVTTEESTELPVVTTEDSTELPVVTTEESTGHSIQARVANAEAAVDAQEPTTEAAVEVQEPTTEAAVEVQESTTVAAVEVQELRTVAPDEPLVSTTEAPEAEAEESHTHLPFAQSPVNEEILDIENAASEDAEVSVVAPGILQAIVFPGTNLEAISATTVETNNEPIAEESTNVAETETPGHDKDVKASEVVTAESKIDTEAETEAPDERVIEAEVVTKPVEEAVVAEVETESEQPEESAVTNIPKENADSQVENEQSQDPEATTSTAGSETVGTLLVSINGEAFHNIDTVQEQEDKKVDADADQIEKKIGNPPDDYWRQMNSSATEAVKPTDVVEKELEKVAEKYGLKTVEHPIKPSEGDETPEEVDDPSLSDRLARFIHSFV